MLTSQAPQQHRHRRSLSLVRAGARARARGRSAGAAMFIVAVTLGMLAAMGVYGLSATASDIRASGQVRSATQVQHAAEQAIIMTSETLQPGTAAEVVRAMQAQSTTAVRASSAKCKTAKPLNTGAGIASEEAGRVASACLILSPEEMKNISPIKPWNPTGPFTVTLAPPSTGVYNSSFGEVQLFPIVRVELTNPIDWETPAGFSTSQTTGRPPIYTQVRATVFLELKPGTDALNALAQPAQVVAVGRGRLVVGPYTP